MVQPIIKWAGGKRQLLPEMHNLLPEKFNTYFEPFAGGLALFLSLTPEKAVVNDLNYELYNLYSTVKNDAEGVIDVLHKHSAKDTKEYYLDIRATDRDGRLEKMSDAERAARFIYMNKTSFNGLWRVNRKNQNNVPYANHKNKYKVDEAGIRELHNYLNEVDTTILNGDYSDAVATAVKDDFVYFDPPYIPVTETSNFASYTSDGFGWDEQVRLRELFVELTNRGVKVMYSNADVPLVHTLFDDVEGANIHSVQATRMINSNAAKRGKVGEVLITNY
ncbi:DNA adenine methylase [Weissella sagaensis]|uniref:DNA adenine methylase n=1 Tax=Weissella sagaensis TaxID=2559928 RepID=UPI0035194C55